MATAVMESANPPVMGTAVKEFASRQPGATSAVEMLAHVRPLLATVGRSNIWFVGEMGAGKSTLGCRLCRAIGGTAPFPRSGAGTTTNVIARMTLGGDRFAMDKTMPVLYDTPGMVASLAERMRLPAYSKGCYKLWDKSMSRCWRMFTSNAQLRKQQGDVFVMVVNLKRFQECFPVGGATSISDPVLSAYLAKIREMVIESMAQKYRIVVVFTHWAIIKTAYHALSTAALEEAIMKACALEGQRNEGCFFINDATKSNFEEDKLLLTSLITAGAAAVRARKR